MTKPETIEPSVDPRVLAKAARAELIKRVLIVAAVLLATAAFGLELYNSHQIRQTQLEGTPTGKKLVASADRILDCTQVGGACYEQGQSQTANILASAQRIILLSAACAVDLDPADPVADRVQQITDCVTTRLTVQP